MPPPILSGRLSVIPGTKLAVLESGRIGAPDALIFVGTKDKLFPNNRLLASNLKLISHLFCFQAGLTDGLGTVGYTYDLAEATEKFGWSFVHLQLSSSHSQYGFKKLETDAQDIGLAIDYLRKDWGNQKVILMGHSTG
jgi:hypothetical protein